MSNNSDTQELFVLFALDPSTEEFQTARYTRHFKTCEFPTSVDGLGIFLGAKKKKKERGEEPIQKAQV